MLFVAGMLALGLAAGILAGFFGIGGGLIVIPGLVLLAGMDQKVAQGTTLLMMLPPIGLLAAWEYWRRGEANWPAAALLCAGFILGGYFGARWVQAVPALVIQRLFGVLLLIAGLRLLWR